MYESNQNPFESDSGTISLVKYRFYKYDMFHLLVFNKLIPPQKKGWPDYPPPSTNGGMDGTGVASRPGRTEGGLPLETNHGHHDLKS